jgi:hypothetical protein
VVVLAWVPDSEFEVVRKAAIRDSYVARCLWCALPANFFSSSCASGGTDS